MKVKAYLTKRLKSGCPKRNREIGEIGTDTIYSCFCGSFLGQHLDKTLNIPNKLVSVPICTICKDESYLFNFTGRII